MAKKFTQLQEKVRKGSDLLLSLFYHSKQIRWVGVGGAASSLGTVFANRVTKRPSVASASPRMTSLEPNSETKLHSNV